jgi:tetraacyldisaccharide 4'-kinase
MRTAAELMTRRWSAVQAHPLTWALLAPLSIGYAGVLAVRSAWWGRFARTPPLPTVSIGNLTVGGNGKTPFTLFLATRLRQHGLRVGIVSRGYGGRTSRIPRLVSDGQRIPVTPDEAGDEPVMMAKSFPGPIAVARHRINAVNLLASNGMADAIVLDDGFQHLRLRRDFDLILFNSSVGLGNGWPLPAGPLREPRTAIRRADALVLIESSDTANNSIPPLATELMRGKALFRAQLTPSSMIYSEGGIWRELPLMLDGRRVIAVSGIANNTAFHETLRALGAKLVRTFDYPDHYSYGSHDWQDIMAAAPQAELLITTEKDLVKLERLAVSKLPPYALRLSVTMEPQQESRLLALIMARISRANPKHEHRSFQR